MGKEIVYCGDCGKSLREDDFARGKAQHLDHRPFCTDCKPLPAAPEQIQTSSRLAALKVSTARHPALPAPSTRRRRAEGESSKTPLLVGAALIVAAILILLVFALSSGSRPEELPAPAPVSGPPKAAPRPAPAVPPNVDKAAAVMKELEAVVAATAPPIAILQKCDEVRSVVQGTSFEARFKSIEDSARENRRLQQLDASLEEVKKLRALDPGYERKEEIIRLLTATLPLSGSRRPEVEETLRAYQRDAQAYVRPTAPPVKPVIAPIAEEAPAAAETDAAGNVNHWLVLGPFKNRSEVQGIYDHDLLHPEPTHTPSLGLEMTTREGTKVRWTPAQAVDGKLDFAQALGDAAAPGVPMIAFAACWVVPDTDMEVKFKMYADLSFLMYLDGQKLRNQPRGHKFGEEEDIFRQKLSSGPHLVLFKVASPSGPPYLRMKVTQLSGERIKNLRISIPGQGARKVLYAQSFNEGLDGFTGSLSDDGVNGTKALLVADAAGKERVLQGPISARTVMRFKVKLLSDATSFQLLIWSNKEQANYWVHWRDLRKGEWMPVEIRLADARRGYKMDGPGAEGVFADNFRFHVENAKGDGRALVDDLEILE